MRASEKRKFGRVDLNVTALSLGSVAIGNLFRAISEGEATEVVDAAWDAGIRYFDTAPLYGFGLAELRFGTALRQRARDEYVLSTKVGRILRPRPRSAIDFGPWVDVTAFEPVYDYSYDGTMRAFEDSLQRLALERVDIAFIHDIDRFTRGDEQPDVFRQAMDECFPALERLRNEGTLRAIGVGVNEWEVCYDALRERDFDCFLLAGRYSLLEQEPLDKFLPLCLERNAAIALGGGFNSGILATGAVDGARYNYGPAPAEIMDKVKRIEAICARHDVPLPAVAMQFVMAHPAITTLVAGARSSEQIRQSAKWFDATIPDQVWLDLKAEGLLRQDSPTPDNSD